MSVFFILWGTRQVWVSRPPRHSKHHKKPQRRLQRHPNSIRDRFPAPTRNPCDPLARGRGLPRKRVQGRATPKCSQPAWDPLPGAAKAARLSPRGWPKLHLIGGSGSRPARCQGDLSRSAACRAPPQLFLPRSSNPRQGKFLLGGGGTRSPFTGWPGLM